MHSNNDNIYNIEIIIYDKADEVIKELFELLLYRCQTGLEISIKGSDFIFNCVNLLYYEWYKIIMVGHI